MGKLFLLIVRRQIWIGLLCLRATLLLRHGYPPLFFIIARFMAIAGLFFIIPAFTVKCAAAHGWAALSLNLLDGFWV